MTKALSSSFTGQQGANGCCLIAGSGIDGVVGDGRYLDCLPLLGFSGR